MLGVQELIIILLIVVVMFGSKRIPEIMAGLGQGIKSFKKAVEEDPVQTNTSPAGPAKQTGQPAASAAQRVES